jgi:hypothetical protein
MLKLVTTLAVVFTAGVCAFAQTQQSQDVATRFGVLSVNSDKMLMFKGQPLSPPIEGNNSLDLGTVMSIGAADVVFVTDNGGTACPALFYFVTLTRTGAKATPAFGTCSEFATVKRKGDSISVTMSGFLGPFEPRSAQRRAARQRHVFIFRRGVVTENGKPVK